MRCIPSASVMVVTAGRPSGTAAIAMEMPTSSMCPKSVTPRSQPSRTTTVQRTRTRTTRAWPSCVSFRSSGVSRPTASSMSRPILPISVRAPVAVTSNRPRPSVTTVPRNDMLRRSPRAASLSGIGSGFLKTAWDSPVKTASSTCKRALSTTRPSAGTRDPALRTTRSPGTSSAAGISRSFFSRRTWAVGTVCRCRAVSACSAFHSVRKPTPVFRRMTIRTATASMFSPSAKATTATPTSRATMRLLN